MRGEVFHMTRNVRIIGDSSETLGKGWGGQIVTSNYTYEFGTLKYLSKGELILDHVEVYNCS